MAQRGRRRKATDTNKPSASAESLIAALKFVSVAQKDIGEPFARHCVLYQQCVYAFDGVLSAGHKIADDLQACPQTQQFMSALSRCGEGTSISQLADKPKLSITSGKFRAFVPCLPFDQMPGIAPDPMLGPIDDNIIKGFEVVGRLATEGAQKVLMASVLLSPNTVTATDRSILAQYWHGNYLPCNCVMPKRSVDAITKAGKKLKGFGYSVGEDGKARTATFYFEDDSWIKTQLYTEDWPDCDRILNVPSNAWPLPKGINEAFEIVLPFANEHGWIMLDGTNMRTDDGEDGASFEIEGLPKDRWFKADYLKFVLPLAQKVDWGAEPNSIALFFGENLRGAVAPVKHSEEAEEDANTAAYAAGVETAGFAPPGASGSPETAPEAPAGPSEPASAAGGYTLASGVPLPG